MRSLILNITKKQSMKRGISKWVAAAALFVAMGVQAENGQFKITDIRVEGLQQVEPGLVFRNFPLSSGDLADAEGLRKASSQLFKSGYFDDIQIYRHGDELLLKLKERPSVSLIRLEGNKVLKKEDLLEGLKRNGLKEGDVFKRSTLAQIQQDLVRLYASQGRYSAVVEAKVEPLSANRVAINIDIKEGQVASIQHINFVGNRLFDDEELRELFELKLPDFWSFYTNADRYAREKLSGDLERLRSFYMDQGYLNFSVDSTNVSISPDKQNIYITVSITEGEKYTLKEVNLVGDMVVPEEELSALVSMVPGDTFSRRSMVRSQEQLIRRIGDDGYMFAKVTPIPEVHEDNTVTMKYFIEPGQRIYVRRINIRGNTRTKDEVVRRELRQMEAAIASNGKIEQSKVRLEKLGFFSGVNLETVPVAGTEDQIDLDISVEEQQSGSFSASLGYSGSDGFIVGLSVQQDNFFGSGKKVSFAINNTASETEYSFSTNDPYYTVDGVSRGFNVYYRTRDFDEDNLSNYTTDEIGVGVNFGYPINDNQRINFGLNLEQLSLNTASQTPQEIIDFISNEGDSYLNLVGKLGWTDNNLNRGFFPSDGYSQSASLELGLPGSDLTYYRALYSLKWYQPLHDEQQWIWSMWSRLGYANDLGANEYPFFKHYFAGGMRSVRGFASNSLGPRDTPRNGGTPDAFGGNVMVTGGTELIFPVPFLKDKSQWRTLFFLDAGNVFDTSCPVSSVNCDEGIDFNEIRYSTGVALSWLTAIGPLSFVLSKPINDKTGDETEVFQFSLGQSF